MNRIIFDYLRRKWWILGFAALLELVIGGCSTMSGTNVPEGIAALQLQLSIFTGAFLLSFDFQRGAARAVAILPLTPRQIGRAWWVATVAIPVLSYSALLFLGAGLACLFNSNAHFPAGLLAMSSLFIATLMGSSFPIVVAMNPWNRGTAWRRGLNGLLGAVWGLMIGGGVWIFHDIYDHPVKFYGFVAFGLALTVVGWLRAEQLVAGRSSFRPGTEAGGRKRGAAPGAIPGGFGGVLRLVSTAFMRGFGTGIAIIVALCVVFTFIGHHGGPQEWGWRQVAEVFENMGFFPFWICIFFSLVPVLMQLRYLRSLPMGATTLAVALMASILLPLLALGMLTVGTIGLVSGAPAAMNVINGYLLTLAPASLSMVFFAWRGPGMLAFVLMFLLMLGAQCVSAVQSISHFQPIPLPLAATITCACVVFSFWLTRLALVRGSGAYRAQANVFGPAGWGRV